MATSQLAQRIKLGMLLFPGDDLLTTNETNGLGCACTSLTIHSLFVVSAAT